jgi:hypothetical protein
LPLLLTALVGEGFCVQVTQLELDEHALLRLDVGHQLADNALRLTAGHAAIKPRVLSLAGSTLQRRNFNGEERLAALGVDLTRPVEISDTEDVEVKIV